MREPVSSPRRRAREQSQRGPSSRAQAASQSFRNCPDRGHGRMSDRPGRERGRRAGEVARSRGRAASGEARRQRRRGVRPRHPAGPAALAARPRSRGGRHRRPGHARGAGPRFRACVEARPAQEVGQRFALAASNAKGEAPRRRITALRRARHAAPNRRGGRRRLRSCDRGGPQALAARPRPHGRRDRRPQHARRSRHRLRPASSSAAAVAAVAAVGGRACSRA